MFTAAIFDGEKLTLVRDAIGKKTLFYKKTKSHLLASSSLKELLSFPQVEKSLNLYAVASFLTFAYLPGNETLLKDIFELLPAHALEISVDGSTKLINYYEPEEQSEEKLTPDQYVSNLRQTIEQALFNQLPWEAEEVGVFLSGGIDSSLIAALAAKFRPGKTRTYSISFGQDNPDETAYSSLIAAYCQTNHRILSFNGKQIADHLAETAALLDCPVGDPLTVPNFLLARAASEDGLSHIFNGEGGDPCFGGPKNLPLLIFALQREKGQNLSRIYLHSYHKCFADLPFLFSEDVKNEIGNSLNLERFVAPFLENPRMNSYLNRLLYANTRTKLAHHILPKVERLTSFWRLHGHSPLADKAIVDTACNSPKLKLKVPCEKWVLKEAVRDLLPETIIDRPKSA